MTQKQGDFLIFAEIYKLIMQGSHLTPEGLNKIMALKASLNLGLNENLLSKFSDIKSVSRPVIVNSGIPSPFWMLGFVTGDGSFNVNIYNPANKPPVFYLNFQITQHIRYKLLLDSFIFYFNCGDVKFKDNEKRGVDFRTRSLKNIVEYIIPFFTKYPLLEEKARQFTLFYEVAQIMIKKEHLTPAG